MLELGVCSSGVGVSGATVAAALRYFAVAQCMLSEPWPPQAQLANGSRFEFVVAGAGTAGATLAARLAGLGAQVLLIEAGGDPPQESIIPGLRDVLKSSRYDWNFTTVNDHYSSQDLQNGSQRQPRGRLLGGSGSISDMVYARGFPADYDDWATQIGEDWAWSSVLQYFQKTERMTDAAIVHDPELMKYHGTSGEIEVTGSRDHSHTTQKFLESFQEIGFEIVDDMTNPHKLGAGRFSHTVKNGRRASVTTSLLNKVGKNDNLKILKNALVTKILIEKKEARGVEVMYENKRLNFYASKEVIVSAGTFNSPKLLMLSGIGPKEHLTELGIEVVEDLPVGDNLQDHVMVLLHVAAKNGTCNNTAVTDYLEMMKYLYDQSGILSYSDSMGAYFRLRGSTTPDIPDFAIYPSCLPMHNSFYDGCLNILGIRQEICLELDKVNKHSELITLAVVLLHPKSRGKVRLETKNPLEKPKIYSGTFSEFEDLDGFPEAMERALSLLNTTHFRRVEARAVEVEVGECKELEGREKLSCKARSLALAAWHAAGSVGMGRVLDSEMRVRGVGKLRVVDASAMPRVPRGNTNAPVIMMAEKAADYIKRQYY